MNQILSGRAFVEVLGHPAKELHRRFVATQIVIERHEIWRSFGENKVFGLLHGSGEPPGFIRRLALVIEEELVGHGVSDPWFGMLGQLPAFVEASG